MTIQQVWETTGIQCTRGVSMGNDQKSMHIHMAYEIYMPQNPGVKCFVNDRIYELEPGDVMLFTDEDLHKAGVPADVRYDRYVITFPPQLLREGKSVSEAAGLSGFGSDTFFITTFKKNVGVTPYRYACRCRPETADTP